MLNKFAFSLIAASALVGTMVAPSYADDDTFKTMCQFPVRVVGAGVGCVLGVPLGAVKDGVKGYGKAMDYTAGALGNKDGNAPKFFGAVFGGPVGLVGGAAYGCADGSFHGLKTGYSQPFSKDSFTFKDE